MENNERRNIVLFSRFTADILQNSKQHFIGRGTRSRCTVHDIVIVIVHLNRHFELTRFANELQTVFGQLQVTVRIYILRDHTHQQRLTQDSMQRALFLITRRTEVLQLVVVITHHLRRLVAMQDIHDMFRTVFLVHLLDGLQRNLQ